MRSPGSSATTRRARGARSGQGERRSPWAGSRVAAARRRATCRRSSCAAIVRDSDTRVLILTTYHQDEYVFQALQAGASGFLLKTTEPDRLAQAIELVAAGEALLAPEVTARLIADHVNRPEPGSTSDSDPSDLDPERRLNALTPREREVLLLIAQGLSNTAIATVLVLSTATVKTHVNRILAKLGLSSRVQLVVLAYEAGLVHPRER